MLDLDDVRAFAEVVDAGSLSRAGARLGMSKSMLSRRIARLEARLGAQLLARTTRGMSVTQAGADFKIHADRIVAEMQAGFDAVGRQGEASGRLRIAAPLSLGATCLAPLLAELALAHPRLEIQTSYSDRRVDLVSEGYDVAIRIGNLPDSSLVARRITSVRAVLVASPAYLARSAPLRTPADLERHETIRQDGAVWRFLDGDREIAFRPNGRFVADSGEAQVAAVVAGLGVSLLPAFLLGPAMSRGEIVQVLPGFPVPEVGMYLLRPPPAAYLPAKVKVLADALVARFGHGHWDGCPLAGAAPAQTAEAAP
jgi:DNA-binding transcriptional LysR family regulator